MTKAVERVWGQTLRRFAQLNCQAHAVPTLLLAEGGPGGIQTPVVPEIGWLTGYPVPRWRSRG